MVEGKLHPADQVEPKRLDGRVGINDYVTDLLSRVRKDEADRTGWVAAKIEAYNRRYAASLFDKPLASFPWVGASNFNMPLSDTHIEEMKPSLMNLVFGSNRIYEMIPMNGPSFDTAPSANLCMDGILKYRMPDYLQQKAYGFDSLGTYGISTDKVYYSYVTRLENEVIRRRALPQRIAQFAVVDDLTPAQQAMAKQIGVVLLSKDDFDARAEQIKSIVANDFQLDPKDKTDRVAIAEIMRFLRNGSTDAVLSFKTRRVVEDTPRVVNVPLQNIVVPMGTRTIAEANRICEWLWLTEDELRQRARDEVWDSAAVEIALNGGRSRIDGGYAGGQQLSQTQRDRIRISSVSDGLSEQFKVAQLFAHWDIDGDKVAERCLILCEPNTGAILKAVPWDDEWPYVDTFLEATDQDRHSSRGIPEQISDPERHATALVRAEQNGLIIETAPMFQYLDSSDFDPMTTPMMPGMMVPVPEKDALQRIDMGQLKSLALESPMRNMLQLTERRISGSNRAVLDLPPPERRTGAEVNMIEGARQRVLAVKAMLVQDGQKREGKLIWNLFCKYGPDRFWTHVTGKAPIRQTQAMIRGEFAVTPVGAVGDLDPDYRANRAMQRLQVATQMHQLLQGDLRYADDLAQAYVDWLMEVDPLAAQRLVVPIPPEQQQVLMQQQQAQAQRSAMIQDIAERLTNNAPISMEEAKVILTELHKIAPHKDMQAIGNFNAMAQQMLQRNQTLAAAGRVPAGAAA